MKKSDLPEFQWTPACQEGFDQLKKALTEAPVSATGTTSWAGHTVSIPEPSFCCGW